MGMGETADGPHSPLSIPHVFVDFAIPFPFHPHSPAMRLFLFEAAINLCQISDEASKFPNICALPNHNNDKRDLAQMPTNAFYYI